MPARALYLAVPSHTGGGPAEPPAHARAAVAITQGARVTAITGANAHGAGHGCWRPPAELTPVCLRYLTSHRTGARALSWRAVPHWRCTSHTCSARPRCCGNHARSACDRHRCGRSARNRAWGLAPASGSQRRRLALFKIAPYRRACSMLPCHPTLAVLQPCLHRTPALLWRSREERM